MFRQVMSLVAITAVSLSASVSDAGYDRVKSSTSIGTTSNGVLEDGVALPKVGEHHSVIDRLRKYETRWGTGELVHLVQHAAEEVYEAEGGAPLRVGELSKRGGGDLRWHRSHNSGRDVDFAFYVVDAETGESVPAPKQVRFDGRGHSRTHPHLRFDKTRNWRLVEALVTQERAPVQWIFVSRPLERLLLRHARDLGADPVVMERAADVMHQPSSASSHANHFHVRILCAPDDVDAGCIDG